MSGPTPAPWHVMGPVYKTGSSHPTWIVFSEDVQISRHQLEANARLVASAPELLDLALAFERWEGDLIMDSEAWRYDNGEPRELPRITGDLWDRLLELQKTRNEVLEKAGLSFEARAEAGAEKKEGRS